MTALLLSPGTGVCKPAMARRRGASRRWRQVTKLPRPFPQHLPFTLRYVVYTRRCPLVSFRVRYPLRRKTFHPFFSDSTR